ncbi:hypothetical protein [Mariniblastus fucicola]|uniref:hypothetical protein n=1 Tax=Mariniblastus fucicola TaxID=980251 RepID=UPI001EE4A1A7|nr:hypothetical protein [Mariniblastus fucicola]
MSDLKSPKELADLIVNVRLHDETPVVGHQKHAADGQSLDFEGFINGPSDHGYIPHAGK